MDLSCWQKHVS